MGPKFYIEDVNEWDSKYSIDYIKFDEFGVIDVVRVTEEKDYLVHGNIAERATGFKDAFELMMEATLLWEFAALEALRRTMQVIRTLIRDKEHKLSEGPIRIRKAS